MKLIVGLGNPGDKYDNTPHNAGYWAIDFLIKKYNAPELSHKKKLNAFITQIKNGDESYILAKPDTYMNESGIAIRALADYYDIAINDIIVAHDEIDIPAGEYKYSTDRGHAGHNGIKSIFSHLGTQEFTRLRIGIADTDHENIPTDKYVLMNLPTEKKEVIIEAIKQPLEEI